MVPRPAKSTSSTFKDHSMHKPFSAIAFGLLLCGLPTAATAQFSESQYDFITDEVSAEFASSESEDAAAADAAAADEAKADASFEHSEVASESADESLEQPGMQSQCGDNCECGESCEAEESCECGDSCECSDAVGCGSESGCDDTCGWFDCCSGVEKIDISDCMGIKECSNLEIGGWTELGFTNNNVPLSQSYNDLLSFNDVPDHLHLNQQWFYFGKKTDGSCGLDLGGRIDMVYGTDAQKTQAFGNPGAGVRNEGTFDAPWDNGEYGWAIPQLYGEVAMGDLTTKVGHFFTPMGYEVIPATGNFFYTHSYTMFNSEPFTHTGVLSTYTGIEGLTLYGGWTLGWDTGFDQLNSGNNWLGGFSTELTEGATFTYISTYGNFGWRDGGGNNSYNHSIVLDLNSPRISSTCCNPITYAPVTITSATSTRSAPSTI
jgi:hypothetical protein